jgi:hypothetical protein
MSTRTEGCQRIVRSVLAGAVCAALQFIGGCTPTKGQGESLAFIFSANPTTRSAESNVPFIGQVQKDRQHFYFVLKGLRVADGGTSAEKPYTAGLTATQARVYLPGVISALIRGQYGAAQTTTVNAYADGTAFAVVTDTTGTTYVVHIDHTDREKVTVSLTWNNSTPQEITDNGFIVVRPGDLKVGAFMKISDNNTLPELPVAIASEVNALRTLAKNAGVP